MKAKRNYHVFHAKLAILVLMWKKKKKNKQSISLSFSWWNQKKKKWTVSLFIHMEVIHLPFSYGITNPMSHHVASRDEEKKNNPSFCHCGKQSFVPCGSNNIRRNNYLSLSHVETIFILMWK